MNMEKHCDKPFANAGVMILSVEALDLIPEGKSDKETVIFENLDKGVYAFNKPDSWYIKDMGTPERLNVVREHL